MNSMKGFAIVTLWAAAGQASAGGPVVAVTEAPVVVAEAAPAFDWTGFYGGLSFGTGTASDDGGLTDTGTDPMGIHFGYLRDLGSFVAGGELAYVRGGYDDFPAQDWTSTRLKLIGGFDAGRFLPYAFVGLSDYQVNGVASISDTVTIFGLGGRYAVGREGRFVIGLEYLVENKSNFAGTGYDLENSEIALRLDYRF